MRRDILVFALAWITAVVGCGESPDLSPVEWLAPSAVDGALVMPERGRGQVLWYDLASFRAEHWSAQGELIAAEARRGEPEATQLLVIEDESKLHVLQRGSPIDDRVYNLEYHADRIMQSDDGKFALLYSTSALDQAGFEGRVGVMLMNTESQEVFAFKATSDGSALRDVVFGRAAASSMAALRWDTHLTILNPLDDRGAFTIRRPVSSTYAGPFTPTHVVFAGTTVVIADASSSSLLELRWTGMAPPWTNGMKDDGDDNVIVSTIELGAPVISLMSYSRDGDHVIVVTHASDEETSAIHDIDIGTGAHATTPLSFVPDMARLLTPSGSESADTWVAWSVADREARLASVDLRELSIRGARNVTEVALDRGLHEVHFAGAGGCPDAPADADAVAGDMVDVQPEASSARAVLVYGSGGGGVYDWPCGTLRSFGRGQRFDGAVLAAGDRILIAAPPDARTAHYVDLAATGQVHDLVLPRPAEQLLVDDHGKRQYVVAVHDSTLGDVTVVDLTDAELHKKHHTLFTLGELEDGP